jgi:UDP-N-acetylglucosamine 2-epimerase (non-hydrolysing)
MATRTVMTVFGTRPEAIKLAPVLLALRDRPGFRSVVAVTGQHREMLDQVLDLFGIRPDHDLGIQRDEQTLTGITLRALEGLDSILGAGGVDLVLVQGDTTTTFAASLAAFYHRIPVVHVEAGLRTGDAASPFPEEINRRLTTQLSSLHLAPTGRNVANLLSDGVPEDAIVCTGNTVIDALQHAVALQVPFDDTELAGVESDPRRLVLVTVHRRESWGPTMDGIGRALARLAADSELLLVIPIHRNPVVRRSILPAVEGLRNVRVVEPLPYGTFARLLSCADVVLTDSGGIQEEAPSLGKPVLVLRDTTERPEAVEAGTVALVGTDEDRIVQAGQRLLSDPDAYQRMAQAVNPYGDGRAAARTVAALAWFVEQGPRPEEFRAPAAPDLTPSR